MNSRKSVSKNLKSFDCSHFDRINFVHLVEMVGAVFGAMVLNPSTLVIKSMNESILMVRDRDYYEDFLLNLNTKELRKVLILAEK